MSTPPVAPKQPYLLTQHGRTRRDDYYWLRDRDNPATLEYLKAEKAYLDQVMAHTAGLQETLQAEMKARIPESDRSAPLPRGPYIYYTRIEPGQEYPVYCRKSIEGKGTEEILLDQNELAAGQPYCGLGAFETSPDHTRLAYLLDNAGGETFILYVKDLRTGELLPDQIPNTSGYLGGRTGLAWAQDNQTIYYTTLDDAHRPYRLYRHRLGANPTQDELVYEETDITYGMYITPSRSMSYLWVNLHSTSSDEVRFLSLADPNAPLLVVAPRQPLIEYSVDDPGNGCLMILTNDGAPNFRLVSVPLVDLRRESWKEILPNQPDVTLETALAFRHALVVIERSDGLRKIRLSAPDGQTGARYVSMPEPAYTIRPDLNPEFDTREFRFLYTSLVTPLSVVDYDLEANLWTTRKVEEVASGYDASRYVTERIFALAPDGQRVPLSLVYRKDLRLAGPSPLVLYG